MSAIALTVGTDGIILLSDGRFERNGTGEIEWDCSKIHPVSGNICMSWMGWTPDHMRPEDLTEHLNPNNAPMHIEALAGKTKDWIGDNLDTDIFGGQVESDSKRICIMLVGYDIKKVEDRYVQNPVIWKIDSHGDEKSFEPTCHPMEIGDSTFITNSEAVEELEVYAQCINEYSGLSAVPRCKKAFTETTEELQGKGIPVGGEVFWELVKPIELPPAAFTN